jgi:hypothetical protein
MPNKASIRIFDSDLTFKAEIDAYSKLVFKRELYKAGTFTINIAREVLCSDELQKNRIIMINNDVNKVGIIKQLKYTTQNNTSTIEVQGYELKGIFKQRITIPTNGQAHQSFSSVEAETIIKSVIQRNCLDLTSYNGKDLSFSNLVIDTDQARGNQFDFNTRYKNLEAELEKICRLSSLGTSLYLDLSAKKYNFEIVEGSNLTATGGAVNPVIFSLDYDNIEYQNYIVSDINSSNFAIIGGQGEAELRTIEVTGGTETDIDLNVTFVDARDLNTTADLIARGNERLAELVSLETFDCQILPVSNYEYQSDYDLGDLVTVQDKSLGVSIDRRILAVTEYYANNGFDLEISFGDEVKGVKEYIDTGLNIVEGGVI